MPETPPPSPPDPDHCLCCRQPTGQPHEDACVQAEHEAMLAGDAKAQRNHDPEECYHCLRAETVESVCRCGLCCRLLIETCIQDAEMEPKIKERGSPICMPAALTGTGKDELTGYLLNGKDGACVFLDQVTNLCTIHATRPLVCRLFNCDGEGREQLIELGYLKRDDSV